MKKQGKMLVGGLVFSLVFTQGMLAADAKGKGDKKGKKPPVADKNRDGIPDVWELKYKLGLGKDIAKKDNDRDGLSNAMEYVLQLNPQSMDSDRDGIRDGNEDFDGDGVTNSQELQAGLNPSQPDTDRDKIPDGAEDQDKDGLTTVQEGIIQTNPLSADTDRDKLPDGSEDKDGDAIINKLEFQLQLNPGSSDSDRDGIADVDEDYDHDSLTNGAEIELGQNPANPDSDRDGIADGKEDGDANGIINAAEVQEFKLELTLAAGDIEMKYAREKGKIKTEVEDESGVLDEFNVQSFVRDLALKSTMTQQELLMQIQQKLPVQNIEQIEVKVKFANGAKLKVEQENKQDEMEHE